MTHTSDSTPFRGRSPPLGSTLEERLAWWRENLRDETRCTDEQLDEALVELLEEIQHRV